MANHLNTIRIFDHNNIDEPTRQRGVVATHPEPLVPPAAIRLMQRQLCMASAAAWANVTPAVLRRPARDCRRIARARQTAIYLAHVVFGHSLTLAGAMVGRDRTTARHACQRVEEWREDRRIDRAFEGLEAGIRSWTRMFAQGGTP